MPTLAPETEALIRAKAARVGKTPDALIREVLAGLESESAKPSRIDRTGLSKLLSELDAMTPRDPRPAKVILDEGWGH